METNEKQIVRVLNNILERIDTLEIQQARNKEFAAVVKKRLLDLNEFVNDVLDIVEGTSFEDDLLFLEEIRELLLMIEEDKDLTYLAEVIEKVEEELKQIEKES